MHWSSQSVIIISAGARRGKALALALAARGATVFAVDVNPDRAYQVVDDIREAGGIAEAWYAEIGNRFQVAALIERARDAFGRITMLVNCTDLAPQRELLTLDEWEWRRLVDVHLTGAFFLTQLMARVMADEGGGLILHCHDESEIAANPASAATRAAIAAMAAYADEALRFNDVRVVSMVARDEESDPSFAERAGELCARLLPRI